MKKKKKLIFLEGNIGAGKSTLLRLLRGKIDFAVAPEQVMNWRCIDGRHDLYGNFLKDRYRWNFTLLLYAFVTEFRKTKELLEFGREELIICDRSIFSSYYAFRVMSRMEQTKQLTEMEEQVFLEACDLMLDCYDLKPDGIIYVKTDSEICFQRSKNRNLIERYSDEYLLFKNLEIAYERWFKDGQAPHEMLQKVPVLTVDGMGNYISNDDQEANLVKLVNDFLG